MMTSSLKLVTNIYQKSNLKNSFTQYDSNMNQFLKTIQVLFSCLIIPVSTFAFSTPKSIDFFPDYYIGAGIGVTNGQFNTSSLTEINPSFSFFSNQSIHPKTSETSVLGSFYIGKLFAFKQFFAGPELYVNISGLQSYWSETSHLLFPSESLVTNTKTSLGTADFGIDGRFGFLVNQSSLLYGRIGASFNQFTRTVSVEDSRSTIPLETTLNNTYAESMTGLRIGLGFEQSMTSRFSIRGDYVYTLYPEISKNITSHNYSTSVYQLGPISNSTSTKANTQTALISLIYHWDHYFDK